MESIKADKLEEVESAVVPGFGLGLALGAVYLAVIGTERERMEKVFGVRPFGSFGPSPALRELEAAQKAALEDRR